MNGKRNPKINTIRAFFPKTRTLFWFSNKGRGNLPLSSSWMPVNVVEYASISLNIHKCPWKCLNKLFWLSQDSEYVWSSYMFDRHLKMAQVLNVPGLWIWLAQLYMQGLHRVPNMAQYASVWLHVPQYVWTWQNIIECLWIYLKMPE